MSYDWPRATDETVSLADLAEQKEWKKLTVALSSAKQRSGTANHQAQPDGTTALHWAVHHQNVAAVQSLLAAKADPNAKNNYGVSPLYLACESGSAKIAISLIAGGSKTDEVLAGGESLLMVAARTGEPEIVSALIENKADVNVRDKKGQTALMWAAAEGNTAVVKMLIAAGAKLDVKCGNQFDALMFATRQGKIETVCCLLDAGLDVEAVMKTNGGGRNPRSGTAPLLMAVESGHFELALELVKRGANPNDQRSGFAPLHVLSWVRKPKVGENPDGDPSPRGSGNIHSLQFVKELVRLGADVNLKLRNGSGGRANLNTKGATPFLMAADTADLPLMKLLLELGANPKLTNADDTSALMATCGIGVSAVGEEPGTEPEVLLAVKFLVRIGLDINHVDKRKETPMHGAAYHNYPQVVSLLDKLGADPKVWNIRNKWGANPIDIASGKRPGSFKPSPETVAALRKALEK